MVSSKRTMILADIQAKPPKVTRAKLDATTEADIRHHMVEDGEHPDAPPPSRVVVPAGAVRQQLGLSQPQFSELTGVPIGTVRNWEQGRALPDPAARALLLVLAREPEAALRALRGRA